MSKSEEQHQQSSDFPTEGYGAAEEERQSLKEEEEGRNASFAELDEEEEKRLGGEEEESSSESATQHKRSERRRGKQRSNTTTIAASAASAWQVTLIDLDKQINKQSRLMERMSDDIRHLRKQFNQVQRDLSKFEKRMQKMKTISSSSAKKGRLRD